MRWRSLVWILFVAALLCFAERASAQPHSSEEQSCKVFVQKFYDWYWNRFADKAEDLNFDTRKLPTSDDVLKLKPPVLSRQLTTLIRKDEKQSRQVHGIANLDFDPFLSSQDPQGKYIVGHVRVSSGRCEAKIAAGNEVAVLRQVGARWVFENFLYSYPTADGRGKVYPDSDLIQILSQ
ncbi:MAG TPA: hypothetical protein VND90_07915 [Terracidiphilus sp.]|nr:hypothetical protein [Terracidiphilus sp.]